MITAQAGTTDLGWLLGAVTVWSVGVFVAWVVWAWLPSNRAALERAGRIPLDDLLDGGTHE